jgi:multidrug efflux pump
MSAFGAALGLMFIILLAQFNSFYNAVLVLWRSCCPPRAC